MTQITMLIFLLAATIFLFIFLYFVPVNLWITAIFSGVQIQLFDLVFMRIRKTPPALIVNSLISLSKAGIPVKSVDLETHYLAGGDIKKLTTGLIKAKNAGQNISWKEAAALDLAGKDIGYHLKKKKLELEGGIDQLREQLSSIILHELTAEQVKEISSVVDNMDTSIE